MKFKFTFKFKLWFLSLIIIFLTFLCGFFIFTSVTTFYLKHVQESNFQNKMKEIVEGIEKNGIDEQSLFLHMEEGYAIRIWNDKEQLFPGKGSYTFHLTGKEDSKLAIEKDEYLTKEKIVDYKNEKYKVTVSSLYVNDTSVYHDVLIKAMPIFFLVGILISAILSIVYARFFSKKVHKINQIAKKISNLTTEENEEFKMNHSKDELEQLMENLDHVYIKLDSTLKQLENELNYIKRLESDQKLFMKGITHELKTPIMAIGTMIEGMLSSYPEYEDKEYHLQLCYRELHRMTKLVNEILDTSKLEHLQFKGETNIKECLIETLEMYEVLYVDKNISIKIEVDNKKNYAIPKKNLLKVFSNLLGNSVKYSPSNSEIKITLLNEQLIFTNEVENVEEIIPENIFKPFYSSNTEKSGHGLGLYIVGKILNAYDYEISCTIENNTFLMVIEKEQNKNAMTYLK